MYDLSSFGAMFEDEQRHQAIMGALRDAVRPGDVFMDIGSGPAVYALEALKLGASHAIACDTNEWIRVGPELAARNGFADRIEFHECLSTDLDITQKADVVFADIRGRLPYMPMIAESFADIHQRLTNPDARVFPVADHVVAALCFDEQYHAECYARWMSEPPVSIDLGPAYDMIANTARTAHPRHLQVVGEPWAFDDIAYDGSPIGNRDVSNSQTVTGRFNGVALWMDTTMGPGHGYTTGPSDPRSWIHGIQFMPFTHPIETDGEEVTTRLRLVDGTLWHWSLTTAQLPTTETHSLAASVPILDVDGQPISDFGNQTPNR